MVGKIVVLSVINNVNNSQLKHSQLWQTMQEKQ